MVSNAAVGVLLGKTFTIKELSEIAHAVKVMELMMNLPAQQHQRVLLVLQRGERVKGAKMCNQMMIIKIPPMERILPMEEKEEATLTGAKGLIVLAKGYLVNKILPLENEELLQRQLER